VAVLQRPVRAQKQQRWAFMLHRCVHILRQGARRKERTREKREVGAQVGSRGSEPAIRLGEKPSGTRFRRPFTAGGRK